MEGEEGPRKSWGPEKKEGEVEGDRWGSWQLGETRQRFWSGCVCLCMSVCDLSEINGYYQYDKVNYSQPIRPEERCSFIWLQYSHVWICACLSMCLRQFTFVGVCVCLTVCASLCFPSNLFVRQSNASKTSSKCWHAFTDCIRFINYLILS